MAPNDQDEIVCERLIRTLRTGAKGTLPV